MEIDYLYEFMVIAKLQSFSLAAEELCISQSSLSKHVKALENELHVQLFDRSTRNVSLSEFGKLILPLIEQINYIKNQINENAGQQLDREKKQLKIASIPVMSQYNITGAIASFQKKYPEVNLIISEREGQDILRLLEDGTYDLVFTRKTPDYPAKFEYLTYNVDRLTVVVPNDHLLTKRQDIGLFELKNENFLLLEKGTILFDICYNACIDANFSPRITIVGHRVANIIDLVSRGMGISLLMKQQAESFKNPDIKCIDIVPTIEGSIILAKLKSRKLSTIATIFWDYISDYIKT